MSDTYFSHIASRLNDLQQDISRLKAVRRVEGMDAEQQFWLRLWTTLAGMAMGTIVFCVTLCIYRDIVMTEAGYIEQPDPRSSTATLWVKIDGQ